MQRVGKYAVVDLDWYHQPHMKLDPKTGRSLTIVLELAPWTLGSPHHLVFAANAFAVPL